MIASGVEFFQGLRKGLSMRHEAAQQPASPALVSDPDATDSAETARLVADAADGDETAWETLVRRYGRRIYALAKSRLHDADAAEEIAQSVFATLAMKLRSAQHGSDERPAYTETGKFEPWLFRIAMNRVRDEGRRRQRRSGTLRIEPGSDLGAGTLAGPWSRSDGKAGTTPDDATSERESRQCELAAMREAISGLEDRDREIIELRHHGSLSFAQIAEMLEEPIGTCLARHHRALKKLRVSMEAAMAGNTVQKQPAGGSNHD